VNYNFGDLELSRSTQFWVSGRIPGPNSLILSQAILALLRPYEGGSS